MTDAVIDGLATARLTRLISKDKIAEPLRDLWIDKAYERAGRDVPEFVEFDPSPPKAVTFITCPWCISMWIGFGVVAARRYVPRAWSPVAQALAFSHLAGLGANLDID